MNAREVTSVTSPSAPVRTFSFAASQRLRNRCVYPTTASTLACSMAFSTRADSERRVARGFSISIGRPRSTAQRIGSTCRCSSVEMIAAVTSGRLSKLAVIVGHEVGADLGGDLLGAVRPLFRDADPTDRAMTRSDLAPHEPDAARPNDGQTNLLRLLLHGR